MWDATFSLAMMPPPTPPPPPPALIEKYFAVLWMLASLQLTHGDLEPNCVGVSMRGKEGMGAECRTQGREMLPMLAVGW